jgi:hypothetical protein
MLVRCRPTRLKAAGEVMEFPDRITLTATIHLERGRTVVTDGAALFLAPMNWK